MSTTIAPETNELTINDYVTLVTYAYPSLYAGRNLEQSKLLILDHLLNTLGNGINFTDVMNMSHKSPTNNDILAKDNTHLFDGTPFFYIERAERGLPKLIHPKTRKEVMSLTLKEIQELGWDTDEYRRYPTISKRENPWTPYPGFHPVYSFIWEYKNYLHELPISFLEAFRWYYQQVENFFQSDNRYLYSYSCPNPTDTQAWDKYLKEWQEIYDSKTADIPDEAEKWAFFSKSYEQEYNGDLKQFLDNRQENMLKEIHDFVNKSIELLDQEIAKKKT